MSNREMVLALLQHPLFWKVMVGVLAALVIADRFRPRRRPLGRDTRLAYLAMRHPEPIASWTRVAMSFLDRGNLLLDEDPEVCRKILAESWKITDEATLRSHLQSLLHRAPMHAWDGLRALRIALSGACAGYLLEEQAWSVAQAVAKGLQARYGSFEEALDDYLESRRAWRGSLTPDAWEREAAKNLAQARRHHRTPFGRRMDGPQSLPEGIVLQRVG
jgi:hypothetical protein